jgi:hypothetical protein
MATFEQILINDIPHVHGQLTTIEFGQMIADPYGFLDVHDTQRVLLYLLSTGTPITYDMFTWDTSDGLTHSPNPCDRPPTVNPPGVICVCTPSSIVSSMNHLRVYLKRN